MQETHMTSFEIFEYIKFILILFNFTFAEKDSV